MLHELPADLLAVILCFASCETAFAVCVCKRFKSLIASRKCCLADAFSSASCVLWALEHPVFALLAKPATHWTPAAMQAAGEHGGADVWDLVLPYWQDGSAMAVSALARHDRSDLMQAQLEKNTGTGKTLREYLGAGPADTHLVGGLVGSLIQPALANGSDRAIRFVLNQVNKPNKQAWWTTVLKLISRHRFMSAMTSAASVSPNASKMLDAVADLCIAANWPDQQSVGLELFAYHVKVQMAARIVTEGGAAHGSAYEWAKTLAPTVFRLLTNATATATARGYVTKFKGGPIEKEMFCSWSASGYDFLVRETAEGGWMHTEWVAMQTMQGEQDCIHNYVMIKCLQRLHTYSAAESGFRRRVQEYVVDVLKLALADAILISYPNGHARWEMLMHGFSMLLQESTCAAFEVLTRIHSWGGDAFDRMHSDGAVLNVLRNSVYIANDKMCRTLLCEMDVQFEAEHTSSLLKMCAEVGSNEILLMLLEKGACATAEAACIAAKNGHSAIVRSLFEKTFAMHRNTAEQIGEAALSSRDIETITAAYELGCFASNRNDLQMRATFFLAAAANRPPPCPPRRLPKSLRAGLTSFFDYPPRF